MCKYIIGVDAGGTKTVASAYDQNGKRLSTAYGDSGNVSLDFLGSCRAITATVSELIHKTIGTPIAICVGCAGIETGNNKTHLRIFLEKEFPYIAVHITNDAELALFAVHGKNNGILIISGTGSIGYSRVNGILSRAGGWGHLIGDDGSGYRIAMDAIRSITDGFDTKCPETPLKAAIFSHLGIKTLPELISFVYKSSKRDIAALVPCVCNCADDGDIASQNILKKAGKDLANLAITLLPIGNTDIAVATSGSIITKLFYVKKSFTDTLLENYKTLKVLSGPFDVPKGAYEMLREVYF